MKARLNGVELYYEVHGSGELMVMTHGAWSDATTWEAVVGPFSEHFEVVVWDRRGHSRSEDGDESDSWQEDVEDLAALIEHLGSRPAHLVGNSAGGSVVLNLLAARPDLVISAIVHEPAAFGLLDGSDPAVTRDVRANLKALDSVIALIEAGEHRRAAERFVGIALGEDAWEKLPDRVHEILTANAPTFLGELRSPFDPKSIDLDGLNRMSVPLVVTAGTESPRIERAAAKRVAELVPRARLEVLTGTGHVPQRTHPQLWIDTVGRFANTDRRVTATGQE